MWGSGPSTSNLHHVSSDIAVSLVFVYQDFFGALPSITKGGYINY